MLHLIFVCDSVIPLLSHPFSTNPGPVQVRIRHPRGVRGLWELTLSRSTLVRHSQTKVYQDETESEKEVKRV